MSTSAIHGIPLSTATALPTSRLQQVYHPEPPFQKRVDEALAKADDSEAIAHDRAVQAHTIFRQNGRILAIVWQDGQAQLHAPAQGFKEFVQGLHGMSSKGQTADAYAQKLEEIFGNSITVERYSGHPDAPTRADYRDEQFFAAIDSRYARRVNITA